MSWLVQEGLLSLAAENAPMVSRRMSFTRVFDGCTKLLADEVGWKSKKHHTQVLDVDSWFIKSPLWNVKNAAKPTSIHHERF